MSHSRAIHIAAAALVAILASTARILVPELWADRVLTFATVGGFLTFYGVVFAVIETWRARGASALAEKAAKDARDRVSSLHNLKNLAECQSCIGFAIKDIDRDGWASTSALTRIVELYTAEFHDAYDDPQSHQRLAIAALQSHAASASGPLSGRTLSRLKETLLSMLSDLAAASGGKLSESKKQ